MSLSTNSVVGNQQNLAKPQNSITAKKEDVQTSIFSDDNNNGVIEKSEFKSEAAAHWHKKKV